MWFKQIKIFPLKTMDSQSAFVYAGRAIATLVLSWVSFSLIAQWTKTDIYQKDGSVNWGNTAYMIFLAWLVAWAITIAVEFLIKFFVGTSTYAK
jgi:hypothetical protein